MSYTPPAGNAVNFDLDNSYTPPAGNAVNFNLSAGTGPGTITITVPAFETTNSISTPDIVFQVPALHLRQPA